MARLVSRWRSGRRAWTRRSALEPEHISAYALIVEPGTALRPKDRTWGAADVDDDDQAEKYEIADKVLSAAGLEWYEVSNWSRDCIDVGANTTSRTGEERAGGASGPERTATSVTSAGGTSSILVPTQNVWRLA